VEQAAAAFEQLSFYILWEIDWNFVVDFGQGSTSNSLRRARWKTPLRKTVAPSRWPWVRVVQRLQRDAFGGFHESDKFGPEVDNKSRLLRIVLILSLKICDESRSLRKTLVLHPPERDLGTDFR
jgi:hypothetical protein